jgi:photosystem II stability/assembly factor-like uncharacterized protein
MRKFLQFSLSFVFLLLFFGNIQAQDWRKVTTRTFPGIRGIYFVNDNTGWAVGASGLVYKSVDAGDNWAVVYDDADSITYLEVFFVDENTGFVGGKYGSVLKSIDGGTNWTNINLPAGTEDVKAIHANSVNQVWVLAHSGSGSKIFSTSDGGSNWQDLFTIAQPANDLHFSGTHGLAVGKTNADLYYTSDGINWNTASAPSLGGFNYTRSDIRGVYMVNSQLGYAVGWGSLIGLQPSIHLKTTDGGATWSYLTQLAENRTYDNLYSVYFKDADNGIAVGGGSRGSVAVRTTDGGLNWVPVTIPCGTTLSTVSGSGNDVWVCGGSGTILRSTDFGDSWILLTPVPGTSLYDIQHLSNGNIVTAGFDGLFIKSTNDGIDWKSGFITINKVTPSVQDIYFVNDQVGFAAHSYGMLTKTTDGGETWVAVIPDTINVTQVQYGVHFVNENYGFSVGKLATNSDMIYKTTDGGSIWELKTNILAGNLRHVAFFNENIGVIVAEKLKAMYTTDGGQTWTPSVFETLPPGALTPNLRKVAFRDINNVTAVGEGIILNSTNGGATWNYAPVDNLEQTLTGLGFSDNMNGWAVGTKSSTPRSVGLYQTTDGGLTWENKVDPVLLDGTEIVYGGAVHGEYLWLCGSPSNIFTNEPVSSVFDEQIHLNDIHLYQNYPNPFNPSTKISFSLKEPVMVSIRIFDVLGKEIQTILNEYKDAGNYDLEFNASGLSSGIYFYNLTAGDLSISRKMTLLK